MRCRRLFYRRGRANKIASKPEPVGYGGPRDVTSLSLIVKRVRDNGMGGNARPHAVDARQITTKPHLEPILLGLLATASRDVVEAVFNPPTVDWRTPTPSNVDVAVPIDALLPILGRAIATPSARRRAATATAALGGPPSAAEPRPAGGRRRRAAPSTRSLDPRPRHAKRPKYDHREFSLGGVCTCLSLR